MAAAAGSVQVRAPLDIAEVDRAREALTGAISSAAGGARRVVVDLTGCDFVDAVGHRMLAEVARSAEQRQVALDLVGVRAGVLRVLAVLDAVSGGDVRAHVAGPAGAAAPQRRGAAAPDLADV